MILEILHRHKKEFFPLLFFFVATETYPLFDSGMETQAVNMALPLKRSKKKKKKRRSNYSYFVKAITNLNWITISKIDCMSFYILCFLFLFPWLYLLIPSLTFHTLLSPKNEICFYLCFNFSLKKKKKSDRKSANEENHTPYPVCALVFSNGTPNNSLNSCISSSNEVSGAVYFSRINSKFRVNHNKWIYLKNYYRKFC